MAGTLSLGDRVKILPGHAGKAGEQPGDRGVVTSVEGIDGDGGVCGVTIDGIGPVLVPARFLEAVLR
jgi:hypothetical protein